MKAEIDPGAPCPAWDGRDAAELVDLAAIAPGRFRSRCAERNEHGRIYGGQLLGQALMAASRTVPAGRPASYMQLLFAAGGIPEQAVDYDVVTIQDGKRFSSRSVRGSQAGGRIVCDANVSFATQWAAPAHQAQAPANCGLGVDPKRLHGLEKIDAPEAADVQRALDFAYRDHPVIDLRLPFVDDVLRADPAGPRMRFFIRIRHRLGDDPALHAAAFAYLSDYWINFVACVAHVRPTAEAGGRLYVASLNHAIWLHAPFRADDWLLFDCASPRSANGRGLAIAGVYAQSGEQIASATQECLLAPA